jgi:hypothetical protein
MGRWDRFHLIGAIYNFPSCSSTVNPLQIVQGDMQITSCLTIEKTRQQLLDAILAASTEKNFCDKENCDGQLSITDDCKPKNVLRARRAAHFESATFTVSYQLNIT